MVENLRSSLDKKSLLIHRHFIMSPSVVNVARNEDLLDAEDVRALADLESNENRINLMLEMIQSRGYDFYRRFLVVLRKSGHNFLADKLDPIVGKKVTFSSGIPPVRDITPDSDQDTRSDSSSSSSSSSDSSDSSDDSRRRRRRRKKDKKSARNEKQQNQKDGMLGTIPNLRLPKPTQSDLGPQAAGQGKGHAHAASALDHLYLHYDNTKVSYRRRLDGLRHEENHLRASLIVNNHEQRKCRRNLGMVNSIKRQIAFVNDKQSIMKKNDHNEEDKLKDLHEFDDEETDSTDTWTSFRGRNMPLQKWKY